MYSREKLNDRIKVLLHIISTLYKTSIQPKNVGFGTKFNQDFKKNFTKDFVYVFVGCLES